MTDSIIGVVSDLSDVTNHCCPYVDECITKIPAYEYLDLAISKGLAELAKKAFKGKMPFGQTKRKVLLRHAVEIRKAREAGVSYNKIWQAIRNAGVDICYSYMMHVVMGDIMVEKGDKSNGETTGS